MAYRFRVSLVFTVPLFVLAMVPHFSHVLPEMIPPAISAWIELFSLHR